MNNRNALVVIVAALLLSAGPRAAAEAVVEKTDLFTGGDGGYPVYRIPGIIATPGGVVLAYCEARKDGPADWGHIDVLLRRSVDGGRTWGPPRQVGKVPAGARRNPVSPPRKSDGFTVNSPVAIAEGAGGVVHLLYCVENNRCFHLRSTDAGETFADPVEITSTIQQFRPEYDWKVFATGPGHGVQLESGRLLVTLWLSTSTKDPHHPSRIATIYSDDGGTTWRRGELVPTPGLVNPSETAVAQVDDTVILNIRHEGEPHLRAVVTGRDGASGWREVRFDPALPEPVCMASMLSIGIRGGRKATPLLFCNPHNPDGRQRKNLTVKMSVTQGRSWPHALTIEAGASGYSDLAATSRGQVLCLYERRGTLTLARFDLRDLESAPTEQKE